MTTWEPVSIFSNHISSERLALLILNQTLKLPASVYSHLWSNATFKVAADGGANCLVALNNANPSTNLDLHTVIGDLDSLLPQVRKYWEEKGVTIIFDPDQDSTDFMKAAQHIRKSQGQQRMDIVILGGLGGRVDQAMSVLHHLYTLQKESSYASGKVYLLSSESISFVLQSGNHIVKVKQHFHGVGLGKHVGIIPLKEASIISTTGLEWDVSDWKTEIGGQLSTSNHVQNETITIQTTKDVLFTIDLDIVSHQNTSQENEN